MRAALATDSRYAKLKAHRFTLTIPACVTTCATAWVEPDVTGCSSPPAPMQNRSVIAVGTMRSPSPVATGSGAGLRNANLSDASCATLTYATPT